MRRRRLRIWIWTALAFAGAGSRSSSALAAASPSGASGGVAYSIQLQATIDPATQKWISSALDDAASENAKLAIIRLDTPGGLSDSMRSIIEDMGAAPMPVVVYVYPNNARAGSAGAYITEAADVAAMYPSLEHRLGDADRDRPRRREPGPRRGRSRTTPPPRCGRWRRPTGETQSSPSCWSPRRRT